MDDARPVLLYDGHCRFCIAQADRLSRWTGDRLRLVSFRDPGVLARYPSITPEACEAAMQLVLADGRVVAGGEAAARALALRPVLVPLAALYFVPGVRQLADLVYRLIARNRFHLGGRTCTEETCGLHEPR